MSALWKLACVPWHGSYEAFTGHLADQVTHKYNKCEWERNKWTKRVIDVKHKWLLSVSDEMQVPAECPVSSCRGRAADLRANFTDCYKLLRSMTYLDVVSKHPCYIYLRSRTYALPYHCWNIYNLGTLYGEFWILKCGWNSMLKLEVSVSKCKNLESMSVLTRYSTICNKRFFAKNIYSQVNLCSFYVYIIIYFTKLAARISLNASQFQHL